MTATRRFRLRAGALAAGVVLALGAGVAVPAPATADKVRDRERSLDRQLDDLREQLEGTATDLVAAAITLKRSQVQQADAEVDLAAARDVLAEAQRKDRELGVRLAVAEADESKASRDLNSRRSEELQTRQRLGAIARQTYVSSGLSGLAVALNAASPAQFADRASAASTALRVQNGAISRLDVQQAETRAREDKLSAARAEVTQLKEQAEAVVAQRQAAEQAQATLTERIAVLVALQQRTVVTIEARKAAEIARIKAMEAEQNRLQQILAARARDNEQHKGSTDYNGGSGILSRPVTSPITSGFGMRFHPILHIWRLHAGTDFGAPCGTPVHASASGVVVRAGWAGGYGNQLVIDHGMMRGYSIATGYNHLSKILVHSGRVSRGEVVAYTGTTGLSTGCHLHYEVFQNGTRVNPMRWL